MRRRDPLPLILVPLLAFGAGVLAEGRSLGCRLYIADAANSVSTYESEAADRSLTATRLSSVCVFADGSVAHQQFVEAQHAAPDGASGSSHGHSVCTFEDGDTLTLAYEGGWDDTGYAGVYEVLGGTGAYEGASGSGTITGVQSPWTSTGIVDIAIDVTTPDA